MPDLTKAPGMDSPNLQTENPRDLRPPLPARTLGQWLRACGWQLPRPCCQIPTRTIESMVADIDASQDHVHLISYIWLPDNNGLKVGRGTETGRRA